MEIIVIIAGIVFFGIAAFILFERPYYISAILIFMVAYGFNLKIPGPLDARGLVIVILFLRLILFDKENMHLIKKVLFSDKYFYMVAIFIVIDVIVTYLNSNAGLKDPVKSLFLNLVSLILGFIIVQ